MTLRTKIFGLFLLLAVAPLLVLGLALSRQAEHALDALIRDQLQQLAERAAAAVERRHALHRSDMLLLSENVETLRLLDPGRAATRAARDSSTAYLNELWLRMREQYAAIELLDRGGIIVETFGERSGAADGSVAHAAVLNPAGDTLGFVRAHLRPNSLLPASELTARFGSTGRVTVVSRETGQLIHPTPREPGGAAPAWAGAGAAADERGAISYSTILREPPWDVIATAQRAEFAAPFDRLARWALLVLLLVVLSTTTAFGVLLHRATRSLRTLTTAADAVGRGDFEPVLPRAGRDDVGRLAAGFNVMVQRIRDMIAQLEASRQMAVLGEFAARLSHELRNPLTAVKLNLQALDRDARTGRLSAEHAARPLEIALREIGRLDDVLRGVLDLARMEGTERRATSVHGLIAELRDLLAAQARQRGVEIRIEPGAAEDTVVASPGQLKGALLNVLLNGLESAPRDSVLTITTGMATAAGEPVLEVRVRDRGAGVPERLRRDIFRPFFTTRAGGTGLGLPLAARVAEELGGSLELGDCAGGAEFVLRLPLARTQHAAATGAG